MRTPQDILENMEELINKQKKEIASLKEQNELLDKQVRDLLFDDTHYVRALKELIIQATPYVEYAVRYSTPLSQKLSEEWLEKTQERREK